MAKVFVCIPTWQGCLGPILDKQIDALSRQQQRDELDIHFLVNNTDEAGFKEIERKAKELNAQTRDFGQIPFPLGLENLWNYAREQVLKEDYTHLWILGGDNIPVPEYHFAHLLEADKDVIASPAFLKDSTLPATNVFQLTDTSSPFYPYKGAHELPLNQIFQLTEGMGTASLLAKKKVLQPIKFRWRTGGLCFLDTQFSEDIFKHGFEFYSTTLIWTNHTRPNTTDFVTLATDFPYCAGEFVKWRSQLNWGWWKYA